MSDLNIRDVDAKFVRAVKGLAANEGITLKDWVVRAIEEAMLVRREREVLSIAEQREIRERIEAMEEPDPEPIEVADGPDPGPCGVCGQKLLNWGPSQVRCEKCGRNYPR